MKRNKNSVWRAIEMFRTRHYLNGICAWSPMISFCWCRCSNDVFSKKCSITFLVGGWVDKLFNSNKNGEAKLFLIFVFVNWFRLFRLWLLLSFNWIHLVKYTLHIMCVYDFKKIIFFRNYCVYLKTHEKTQKNKNEKCRMFHFGCLSVNDVFVCWFHFNIFSSVLLLCNARCYGGTMLRKKTEGK